MPVRVHIGLTGHGPVAEDSVAGLRAAVAALAAQAAAAGCPLRVDFSPAEDPPAPAPEAPASILATQTIEPPTAADRPEPASEAVPDPSPEPPRRAFQPLVRGRRNA